MKYLMYMLVNFVKFIEYFSCNTQIKENMRYDIWVLITCLIHKNLFYFEKVKNRKITKETQVLSFISYASQIEVINDRKIPKMTTWFVLLIKIKYYY